MILHPVNVGGPAEGGGPGGLGPNATLIDLKGLELTPMASICRRCNENSEMQSRAHVADPLVLRLLGTARALLHALLHVLLCTPAQAGQAICPWLEGDRMSKDGWEHSVLKNRVCQ